MDVTQFGCELTFVNIPTTCCSLEQHLSSCRAGNSHRHLTSVANRRTTSSNLEINNLSDRVRACVHQWHQSFRHTKFSGKTFQYMSICEEIDCRSLCDIDLFPTSVKLICCHHGKRCMYSLTHFGMRYIDCNFIVWIDFNKRC